MPTLNNWLHREYDRLVRQGKSELAECFDAYRQAFFDFDYQTVLGNVPVLHSLSVEYDEPGFRIATDYYRTVLEAYWLGDLAKGLDIAHQSAARARHLWGVNAVLELYVRLNLLHAWLDTDGPGFAPTVLESLDSSSAQLPTDLGLRFTLLQATSLMRLGQGDRAYELMQGVLARPELDWPAPYHHALRADALQHVGRLDDALAEAEAAITGFVEMGYPIEANGMRLQTADLLLQLDRSGDALERIDEALSSAERLPNRAHMGMARGLLGRALACVGDPGGALNALKKALDTLDGLGWLRHEAELSLAGYEVACRASSVGPRQRDQWQADTEARVRRLHSTDLQAAYRRLAQSD